MSFNSVNGPKIVTNGLVGCWDAASARSSPGGGTTWTDLSKNGNDGTLTNGPTIRTSHGGSVKFDGTDDYVDCGTSLLYTNSLTEFSVSIWSYVTVANFNGTLKVICADAVDPSLGGFWVGYDDRGGTNSPLEGIAWNTKNAGGYSRGKTADNIISSGGWFNVVLTFSSSVGVTCYVNTQESTNRTINDTGDFSPRNNNFNIGSGPTGMSSDWYFNGSVASVAIYNRVLTIAEIKQNYYATKGRFDTPSIVTDSLVLHLDAGDDNSYPGTGTTWTDLSGEGNNGTLTNGPTFSSSDGGEIVFDGSNDHIELGDILDIGTDDYTVEAWAKGVGTGSWSDPIVSKNDSTGNDRWALQNSSSALSHFHLWINGTQYSTTGPAITSGSWAHRTATLDRDGNHKLYIDGIEVDSISISSQSGHDSSNSISLHIGRQNTMYLNGSVAIARIYKGKALTSGEVLQNYRSQKGRFV